MKRLANRGTVAMFPAVAASSRVRSSKLLSCNLARVTAIGAGMAALVTVLTACGQAGPAAPTAASPAPSPPAAVQISGHVYDTLSRPVADARVEVIDGPSAGTTTITGADGAFTLSATLSAGAKLRATKAGFESAVAPLQNAEIRVWLRAEGTVNITGQYTVTVEADQACSDLPPAARKRTYDATVVPAGGPGAPFVTATLLNPTLDGYFRVLYLHVGGDTVDFDLSDNGIVEEIGDEAYFSLGGYGRASGATEGMVTAAFKGSIDYCEVKPGTTSLWPCAGPVITHVQCQSSNHRLILMRR